MGVPATTGQLRTNIDDMEIGDYIKMNLYTGYGSSGTATFIGFGERTNANYVEGSLTGEVNRNNKDIFSYFIKVDKGLLISDRVIVNTVSWDILNSSNYIQGKKFENGINRSLTGGVAYADADGNKIVPSTTDARPPQTFPNNNEFDIYLKYSNLNNKIIPGDDNVWHHSTMGTWCQETPINGINTSYTTLNNYRMNRGNLSSTSFYGDINFNPSSTSNTSVGFRPVFAYQE